MQPLAIAMLQTDLFWEDPARNLLHIENQLAALPAGTHLTILPEMFSTGFSMNPASLAESMDGPAVTWMKRIAVEKKTILVGSLMIRESDRFFNRLLWVLPNGEIGQYDKRHLFAYAEEDKYYTAGKKRLIAGVNGWRINLQICYDLRFPVWSRQQSTYDEEGNFSPEYDLLVYVANWPQRRADAWNTLLRARAIENQCYVIGVNRIGEDGHGNIHAGDSQLIGPMGEVMHTSESRAELHSFQLDPSELQQFRQRFPFLGDADGFMIFSDDLPE